MSLEHDHTLNPVTALEFFHHAGNLLVLAGEGTYMKVFEANSGKLVCQCQVFDAQTVHGIVLAPGATSDDLQLVIWGGSSLVLLSASTLESLLSQDIPTVKELEVVTADWILDVIIDPSHQGCVLVTAHNTLFQARFGTDGNTIDFKSLSSPSRSILYSAHLVYDTTNLILVAAGTVFGEIIVWECALSEDQEPAGCRVLCTLTGHEGSIFGVNISPPVIDSHGTQTRLLASCSDDRTIRLWDIHGHSKFRPSREHATESELRETGFGDTSHLGSEVADTCLAMSMGHASRIWGVKFYQSQLESSNSYSSINILSFGEDSTTQKWSLGSWEALENLSSGVDYTPRKLNHAGTFAYHRGKHIWSRATRDLAADGTILITGGADGRIPCYRIPSDNEESVSGSPILANFDDVDLSATKYCSRNPGLAGQSLNDHSVRSAMFDFQDILNQFTIPYEEMDEKARFASRHERPILPLTEAKKPLETNTSELKEEPQDGKNSTELAPANKKKKPKPVKIQKDALNRYDFVCKDELVLTTTFGRIFHCYIGESVHWRELFCLSNQYEALRSYSVIKGSPKLNAVFLAGATGDIYMYQSNITNPENFATLWRPEAVGETLKDQISQPLDDRSSDLVTVGKLDSKVADMVIATDLETSSLTLFAVPITGKTITKFIISLAGSYSLLRTSKIQLPDAFLVTSAQVIGSLTVVGARNGAIAVYMNEEKLASFVYFAEPGERDAITAIVNIKTDMSRVRMGSFLTTCRNGTFSIFTVTEETASFAETPGLSVSRIHHGTPPFGPMIELAWFSDSDLYLYGFRSKYFVIWNETQQRQVAEVECGGAHRTYAYSPPEVNNRGGHFAYTKASKLYIHTQKGSSHRFIKEGGHGREIKSCAVSPDGNLIATGAEDTMIRLWKYHDEGNTLENRFESLTVIKKHTTGIQHLQWHGPRYLFSSGGTEEFFVWAVTSVPEFGVGIMCEAACPDRSEDGDLRITSFDVSDMLVSKTGHQELLISIAYSDSTIRTYRYSKEQGFNLLSTGRYTSICLTQLRHVYLDEEQLFILTAATDGKIAIWKAVLTATEGTSSDPTTTTTPSELQLVSKNELHQSSIKSLDILKLNHGRFIVATGGDDNAIGVAVYSKETLLSGTTPTRSIIPSAHAAAVTGLAFVPGKNLQLVSSGNDQRVKKWNLSIAEDGNDVTGFSNAGDVFTSVADVGDLSVLKNCDTDVESAQSKVLIVGVGMDVWRVRRNF